MWKDVTGQKIIGTEAGEAASSRAVAVEINVCAKFD